MPSLSSKDCVTIRHPGQVRLRRTRALLNFPEGTLFYRASRDPEKPDYIELSLDSGSRPPQTDSSGMTGSANCDIVSNAREMLRS